MLVVLVQEGIGANRLGRIFLGQLSYGVKSEAVDQPDSRTFQNLNQIEVGEENAPVGTGLSVADVLLRKNKPGSGLDRLLNGNTE